MATQKKVNIKEKKGKKRWFSVLAPAIFNQKPLPDIIAFEPNELVGRRIEVSLKEFTSNPKDATKKIVSKIIKTQGDTAHTEVDKLFISDSYIQRTTKRFQTRIIVVQKVKTKDAKTAKIKSLVLIDNKVQRAIRTSLAKIILDTVDREISKKSSQELFGSQFLDKVLLSSKKSINKIYPVARALIWKVSILS